MNFLGQQINNNSLTNGGTITGNLNIEADLSVSGDANFQDITATNAVITGTLEAGTIISDIIVEDPLIHLGKDNPADLQNLGVLEEFNDGVIKFSGILRSKDDKKQYMIEGVTPQPTGSTDITSLNRGDLAINDLDANLLIVNNVASTQAVNTQSFGVANIGLVNKYKIAYDLATDSLVIKNESNTDIYFIDSLGNITSNGNFETLGTLKTDVGLSTNLALNMTNDLLSNGFYYDTVNNKIGIITQGTGGAHISYMGFYGLNIDAPISGGNALNVGSTNATIVNIGSPTINTLNKGDLDVDGYVKSPTFKLLNYLMFQEGVELVFNFDLDVENSRLSILGSKLIQDQYFNSSEGIINIHKKSRGSKTTKTPLLFGDKISTTRALGYNSSGDFDITSIVEHRAGENLTATSRGGEIAFSTVNIGTAILSEKMVIGNTVKLNTDIDMLLNDISDVNTLTAINTTTDNLTVGPPISNYTLPTIRGTAGYVLATDGLGGTSWQPEVASSETLQEAYDVSVSPQITSVTGLTVRSGTGLNPGLEVEDSGGTKTAQIFASGLGLFNALQAVNPSNLRGLSIGSIPSGFQYNLPADNQTAVEGDILKYSGGNVIFKRDLNFSQTVTTSNITGTVDEIEMLGAGIGYATVPANSLEIGSTFHINLGGFFRNANTSSDIRVRVKLGSSIVSDTNIVDLPFINALGFWEFECDLAIRNIGVGALSVYSNQFTYVDSGSYAGNASYGAGVSFDSTVSNDWSVTVQYSTANISNACYCQILYIKQII